MNVTQYNEHYHYPVGDGTDLKIDGKVRSIKKYHQEMADFAKAFNEAHPDLRDISYVYCPVDEYYLFACQDTMVLSNINAVEEALVAFMEASNIDFG
ncbi:hypothetical protein VPHD528_0116 [Vibrio phage D528]|nr:hypothetical protein MYOV002v2_p0105 [Vibrio phage 144E46.1]